MIFFWLTTFDALGHVSLDIMRWYCSQIWYRLVPLWRRPWLAIVCYLFTKWLWYRVLFEFFSSYAFFVFWLWMTLSRAFCTACRTPWRFMDLELRCLETFFWHRPVTAPWDPSHVAGGRCWRFQTLFSSPMYPAPFAWYMYRSICLNWLCLHRI